MKDKEPSDPIKLMYVEAEYLLPDDVLIAALEPAIKLAEEKVLGCTKDKNYDENHSTQSR